MKWKLLVQIKGGHRYFRDLADDRIAIADNSGNFPDECEDGVLYLDIKGPITIKENAARIPIYNDRGDKHSTSEYCEGALQVAATFNIPVKLQSIGKMVRTSEV